MADEKPATGAPPPTVQFHYLKAPQFRTIYVDGAIGSVTPQGKIHAALYCERPAIPQAVTYKVLPEKLGEEIEKVGKTGFVRELQVDVFLDKKTAREFAAWLMQKSDELEKLQLIASAASASAVPKPVKGRLPRNRK